MSQRDIIRECELARRISHVYRTSLNPRISANFKQIFYYNLNIELLIVSVINFPLLEIKRDEYYW